MGQKYCIILIQSCAILSAFQQMLWQVRFLNESYMRRYTSTLQMLDPQLSQIETELNSGRF
ncbi:MAG TPA: hypothetical protein DCF33_05055 [Saprospirales bacterium]|nr:hypothetical protein [Saprospirales bacterium]